MQIFRSLMSALSVG